MLKYNFKNFLSNIASYLELIVAAIIVVSVILASIALIMDLGQYGKDLFGKTDFSATYSSVFSSAIVIVIGIEMIKMIVTHTPASVLEVLLFVIAKRVVAEHEFSSLDMLLCVIAIAVIFAIKKFLHFDSYKSKDGTTFNADTKIKEVESLLGVNLPSSLGETLGDVLSKELHRLERKIAEDEEIVFNDAIFRVYSMEDGEIKKVEVVTKKKITK